MKHYIILLLLLTSCHKPYQPSYQKNWQDVNQHIYKSWINYIGTHKTLPHPFNYAISKEDLYYWDTYFTNKGLIRHQQWQMVLNNLNNYIFEIDTLGFIPNTNQVWSLNRSQPPFFSMMVKDYYTAAPLKDKDWLQKAYNAALKEYHFWTDTSSGAIEKHRTSVPGLIRYYQHCDSKTLIDVYDYAANRFGQLPKMTDEKKEEFGSHFFAECESGMDFSWRFQLQCANHIAIDLNSNIYMYEKNFIWFENELGLKPCANWDSLANIRKDLIFKYCWDNKRKIFADYNFVENKCSPVASYCMLYPMLWGFATTEQAEYIKKNLKLLHSSNGITASEPSESPFKLQWDNHSVWPPVQWVAYTAMKNYNFTETANEIAFKYLDIVTKNFLNPVPSTYTTDSSLYKRPAGLTWEKYTTGGNINDNEYPSNEMLGWTGGVFTDLFFEIENK